MAEAITGLALASSIISVIDITRKVVTTGWQCYRGTRNAPKELVDVMSEVMSLHGILDTLHGHLSTFYNNDPKDFLVLEVLNKPDGVLAACAVVLQGVLDILEGLQKKRLGSIITAATSSQKFTAVKGRIERLKVLLLLALSSDHLTLSHAIDEYLQHAFGELRDKQDKIHYELLNIDNHITKLSRVSDEVTISQKEKHEADRYYKTLCWLSAVDFEATHFNACKLQQQGTGLWFIEGRDFSGWAEKDNSTFWLHAIPGAGKTILCSTLIQQLQFRSEPTLANRDQPSASAVVYFYFSFRNSEQQHTEGMLCSLLSQLANKLTAVPEEICGLWEKYKGKKTRPSPEELLVILASVIREYFNKVYIVMDTLDECSERPILLPILHQLMESKCASIFLTSRGEHDIQKSFSGNFIYSAAIESSNVAFDVELFVNKQIKAIGSLRDLSVDLQNEIVQRLVDGAKGMEVYTNLERPKSIRNALKSLPQTLDESYNRILMSIQSDEEKEFIRRTLQFIVFAARPMTVKEVTEAVVIEDNSTVLDPDDRFNVPEHLVKGMRSLLVITGGYLGLSHYSVQEYLQSPRISTSPASYFAMTKSDADEEISRKCLIYLGYDDFNVGPCKSDAEFDLRLADYPFLEYAANCWFIHGRGEQAQRCVAYLFDKTWTTVESPKYLSWYQAFCDKTITSKRKYNTYQITNPSIVYYPALWGLHVLLERLIIDDANVNIQGGYYGQALQAASINQNLECFKLLLDHGADVHAQGGYFGNALQASASVGCEYMIKALLEKNCRVATEGGAYGNALQAAFRSGHTGTTSMLIKAGADVNARGGPFGYALQAAASNGHEITCESLINKGALVNAQGGAFGNALQAASLNGRTRVVELLLKRGAEVNARGGLYSNALLAACLNGHEQVVRLLLTNCADVSSEHRVYATPLQAAAINGFTRVVSLLIQYGADVNQQGGQYANALQAAARNGHERVVGTLLVLGVDVNRTGGYYGSALQAACQNGFMAVVKTLLEHGADPNLQSGIYGDPLQAAASGNRAKIVQLLLERGAKVNAVGGSFHTALHGAAHQGHDNIVEMLLVSGADVGIVGEKYGSALDAAISNGHVDVVERLRNAEREREERMREVISELELTDGRCLSLGYSAGGQQISE
ncbi:hypothetical protein VE03_06936 [Pseudogymnoascus sp. 23342-1-I1]|nr:hypothetical protein VE03_06936 [Pseudogymnoascus sp. 23342-1-I1]